MKTLSQIVAVVLVGFLLGLGIELGHMLIAQHHTSTTQCP